MSAVDPAYLTVNREVDNATFARNLLDTDYIVDNGLIQVRDDGYLSRHNPEIIVKQNWTLRVIPSLLSRAATSI